MNNLLAGRQAGRSESPLRHLTLFASQSLPDLPVLARLQAVARSLDLPEDWREPRVQPDDVGHRPPLESLGPFRWHPGAAPEWTLRDADHNLVSLQQYKGRPVLVVFYLGSGCVHCIEQLNAFVPKSKAFSEAGISIVAIGTESVPDLQKTLNKSKASGAFPFPIVSDATLATFKAYRAFDDFENLPLHGSFLIDGRGLVRWQDISYEPFLDIDFLLREAKRLLALPTAAVLAKATAGPVP
ncbi:MAG: peroxiredoxin family protein [Verrucomicrobiota bacterium]